MPAVVADWIISLATIRLLGDIGPMLFPTRSTSVSISGVNQSTGLPGPDFLLQRLQLLKVKEKQQRMAIRAHFGLNIMLDFIGT